MIRHGIATGLAAACLALVLAGSSAAYTVDEERVAQGGGRLELRCGELSTLTWELPPGSQRIEVLEPVPGQPIIDGLLDEQIGTIQDVAQRTDSSGRIVVAATAVGMGLTCNGMGLTWETYGVGFRARYHLVREDPVLVSDDWAGLHARQRPANLTANADAGWRRLHWRSWGGSQAVARGEFHARRWVPIGYADVVQRDFAYRVVMTLSRIRLCGSRQHHYTRIETRFLTPAPAAVRRQARPPSTATCLSRARSGVH